MLEWYTRNQYAISFFIAGWCALAAIDCFSKGDYLWTLLNAALVYINIRLAK
jgi:hypothetical protein